MRRYNDSRREAPRMDIIPSETFIRAEVHVFVQFMIRELQSPSCNVFGRLEDIIDLCGSPQTNLPSGATAE